MGKAATFEVLAQGRANALTDWDALIGSSYDGTRLESPGRTCRGRLDRLRLGDIRMARIQAEPHLVWRWRESAPDTAAGVTYLHLQERGISLTRQRGRTTALQRGMAAFCDPNHSYCVEFPQAYSVYLIEVPNRLWSTPPVRLATEESIAPARVGLLQGVLDQIFAQMTYLNHEADWAEGVHGALVSVLRCLVPEPKSRLTKGASRALRAAVLGHIDRHLTDPDLSVGSLAQALNINRRSVQRVFSPTQGHASAYILDRRLRMAAAMLADETSGQTVTEIAMACGFADSSHFARCFRSRFGATPSAFRATARGTAAHGGGLSPLS